MHIFRFCSLCLLSLYLFCFFISGCSRTLEKNVQLLSPTPFSYDQYEIKTNSSIQQSLLTGFLFSGETAELIVVNLDKNKTRQLSIYSLIKDKWELRINTTLRPKVLFVDIANIDGQDRLITYEHGQLNWFDPETEVELSLFDIRTHYNPLSEYEIPQIDISRDLNGDGRDDFVLPDIDGFWISTQLDEGMFTDPIKLGPSEPFLNDTTLDDKRTYREIGINSMTYLWYMTRFHLMDYDGDKRNDIVLWNEDHFDVHRQNADGTFSTVADRFSVDVQFDYDGAYSLAFGYSGESTFALISGLRKKTKRKVLHMFRDLNGDGVTDMVVHTLEGRSLGNLKSLYEIYYGEMGDNGIKFGQNNRLTIRPKGKAGGLLPWGYSYQWWQDFDGDGQIEILFKDVKTALGGMVRAMVGKSIAIDLEGYRMQDNSYPHRSTFRHKIRPAMDIFESKRVFFPAVLLGDVNGDTRLDILIGKSWNEMHIYHGIPGPKMIAKKPQKITIAMPNDERNIRLVDMNRDNKKDVLIFHPDDFMFMSKDDLIFHSDDFMSKRVSLLISK